MFIIGLSSLPRDFLLYSSDNIPSSSPSSLPHLFDISGNLTVCQLDIAGVEVGDHGDWTCAVSDSASLETVKQSQSLAVKLPGQLSLSPVQSVQLGEGDLAQLVCRVTAAWPRPTIAWSIDTPASLHTDTQVRRLQVRERLRNC